MAEAICKLEAISFPIESDQRYVVMGKGFKNPSSVDLLAKALRGVFPDNTPILILQEGQSIDIFSLEKGNTVQIKPPMNTDLVALIREMLPEGVEIVNGDKEEVLCMIGVKDIPIKTGSGGN